VSGSTDLLDLIAGQVADVETAWSIGTFGAIAEFTRDAEETAAFDRGTGAVSVVTARGAERISGGHLWIYRSDVRSAQVPMPMALAQL